MPLESVPPLDDLKFARKRHTRQLLLRHASEKPSRVAIGVPSSKYSMSLRENTLSRSRPRQEVQVMLLNLPNRNRRKGCRQIFCSGQCQKVVIVARRKTQKPCYDSYKLPSRAVSRVKRVAQGPNRADGREHLEPELDSSMLALQFQLESGKITCMHPGESSVTLTSNRRKGSGDREAIQGSDAQTS